MVSKTNSLGGSMQIPFTIPNENSAPPGTAPPDCSRWAMVLALFDAASSLPYGTTSIINFYWNLKPCLLCLAFTLIQTELVAVVLAWFDSTSSLSFLQQETSCICKLKIKYDGDRYRSSCSRWSQEITSTLISLSKMSIHYLFFTSGIIHCLCIVSLLLF